MRLLGKTAIITGAGSGIGKAMALKFGAEGANVVAVDMNIDNAQITSKQIIENNGKSIAVKTNVADKESVDNLFKITIETYGKVEILINCAGILRSTQIEDLTVEEWDLMMAVNLRSVFLMSQRAVEDMRKYNYGRIITIASNAGRDGGESAGLSYAASKAGVIGFMRGLAKRTAQQGITVNCIAPGTTMTDMIKNFSAEDIEHLKSTIPVRRLGKAEDYAEMAALMCTEYGSFMTGAVVDMNGGLFIG